MPRISYNGKKVPRYWIYSNPKGKIYTTDKLLPKLIANANSRFPITKGAYYMLKPTSRKYKKIPTPLVDQLVKYHSKIGNTKFIDDIIKKGVITNFDLKPKLIGNGDFSNFLENNPITQSLKSIDVSKWADMIDRLWRKFKKFVSNKNPKWDKSYTYPEDYHKDLVIDEDTDEDEFYERDGEYDESDEEGVFYSRGDESFWEKTIGRQGGFWGEGKVKKNTKGKVVKKVYDFPKYWYVDKNDKIIHSYKELKNAGMQLPTWSVIDFLKFHKYFGNKKLFGKIKGGKQVGGLIIGGKIIGGELSIDDFEVMDPSKFGDIAGDISYDDFIKVYDKFAENLGKVNWTNVINKVKSVWNSLKSKFKKKEKPSEEVIEEFHDLEPPEAARPIIVNPAADQIVEEFKVLEPSTSDIIKAVNVEKPIKKIDIPKRGIFTEIADVAKEAVSEKNKVSLDKASKIINSLSDENKKLKKAMDSNNLEEIKKEVKKDIKNDKLIIEELKRSKSPDVSDVNLTRLFEEMLKNRSKKLRKNKKLDLVGKENVQAMFEEFTSSKLDPLVNKVMKVYNSLSRDEKAALNNKSIFNNLTDKGKRKVKSYKHWGDILNRLVEKKFKADNKLDRYYASRLAELEGSGILDKLTSKDTLKYIADLINLAPFSEDTKDSVSKFIKKAANIINTTSKTLDVVGNIKESIISGDENKAADPTASKPKMEKLHKLIDKKIKVFYELNPLTKALSIKPDAVIKYAKNTILDSIKPEEIYKIKISGYSSEKLANLNNKLKKYITDNIK